MDTNTALIGTGTSGTILTILYFMYKMCNHKRLRCRICGKDLDVSIDLENTTPPEKDKSSFQTDNPIVKVPS